MSKPFKELISAAEYNGKLPSELLLKACEALEFVANQISRGYPTPKEWDAIETCSFDALLTISKELEATK